MLLSLGDKQIQILHVGDDGCRHFNVIFVTRIPIESDGIVGYVFKGCRIDIGNDLTDERGAARQLVARQHIA